MPSEAYRMWRLCQVVGPPNSWMDLPADDLDWVLAIDDTVAKARQSREEAASRG